MRTFWTAISLAFFLGSSIGCCCNRPNLPVDLETICGNIQNRGKSCKRYPYSCPPCPYYDPLSDCWRRPWASMNADCCAAPVYEIAVESQAVVIEGDLPQ